MIYSTLVSPNYLADYSDSEEREVVRLLNDKSQELASKFDSVKVEFCDLDGMGRTRELRTTTNAPFPSFGEALKADLTSVTATEKRQLSGFAAQIQPSSIITPPLRTVLLGSNNSNPTSYFSLQRKSSLGKPAANIKRRLSFKRKKDAAREGERKADVELNDTRRNEYTDGIALYRSGFSGFVPATGTYDDGDSDSDTSSLVEQEFEDDVETPRPLPPVREASSDSYFDERPSVPFELPTIPLIPSPPAPLLLDDSLDPDADLSSLPQPTLPAVFLPSDLDSDTTIRPSLKSKTSKHRRWISPLSLPASHFYPPGLESNSPVSSASRRTAGAGSATTLLSPVSVQVKFSPTLTRGPNAENEGNGFLKTSCASEMVNRE